MMKWLKSYWIEVLVFSIVYGCILNSLAPSATWMMVDSDGVEYVMDAKYFYPAHHTSAPLYLLIGHLFLYIPYGTEYWRMSLMSGVFTLGSMIFIYLIVRRFIEGNKGRYYGLLASVIFGGSALAFAQAIIVETYAVVTFFSVSAYYFSLKKQWYLVAIFLGMGLVTHHLILLTWVVLLVAHRELRQWKTLATSFSFLIFYLYIPLSVRFTDQPSMWGNTGFIDFFTNNIGVFTMLVGQKAIYDFPKAILDMIGVLGISLGLALILVVWYFVKQKNLLRNELFWLFILPILYIVSDLALQIMKYAEASIAFGAIIAVVALSRINKKWLVYSVSVSALVILGASMYVFDIGNTLDPELSATKFYNEELPKIPDGQIFITNGAWEWIEVFYYNKENNRHIIPVCMGILPSDRYRSLLREQGVKIDELNFDKIGTGSHHLNTQQVYYSLNIIDNNAYVWTSKPTHPETYGAMVVPANENKEQLTKWLGQDIVDPKWQWIPSSPYDSITGSIEVSQWVFILQSNRTTVWLATWVGLGYIVARACVKMWKRKKQVQLLNEK